MVQLITSFIIYVENALLRLGNYQLRKVSCSRRLSSGRTKTVIKQSLASKYVFQEEYINELLGACYLPP